MYHLKYIQLFFFLLFLIIGRRVPSQSTRFAGAVFQHITINDGLAHRTTNTIVQDQHGFIWIGTNNGLHRYDGQRMKVYQWDIKDPYSLPTNRIQRLFPGDDGRLWIIGEGGNFCWYDASRDRFHTVILQNKTNGTGKSIVDIAADTSGNIWVVNRNNQLYFAVISEEEEPRFQLLDHRRQDSPSARIDRIMVDESNRLWVGTANDGIHLYKINGNSLQYLQHFDLPGRLTLISMDTGKQVWLSSAFKIYRIKLDRDTLQMHEYYDLHRISPQLKGYIYGICADDYGNSWVSTMGSGLFQLHENGNKITATHYPGFAGTRQGLTDNHLMDLMVDKYNVLWIGSQAGVFWTHLNRKPFYSIGENNNQRDSLTSNIVHAIYRDRNLWIGTRNGLSVVDTTDNAFYNYATLSEDYPSVWDMGGVSAFFKDSRGRFWVGMTFGGLFRVRNLENPSDLVFQPLKWMDRENSNRSEEKVTRIVDIVEDDWGMLWVGTTDNGLFAFSDTGGASLAKVHELEIGTIANLYKDPFENTIWAGTWNNGLVKINLPSSEDYTIDFFQQDEDNTNAISYNRVNPIAKTPPNTLWVGTIGGGLNKIVFEDRDSVRYRLYTKSDGLPDNTIHNILTDNAGNLWLGGAGLTRFNPATEEFTHFDSDDGLQGNLFIVNSDYKDEAGRLYFGGPYGMNFFLPEEIRREDSYPDVAITGLKIRNREVRIGEEIYGRVILPRAPGYLTNITLREKENDITLDFLTIHTALPSKNRLRYRLKGYQDNWIDIYKAHASITYSNLDAGEYTFQVMAANGDGVWNPEITELPIEIRPYWYKTNLAYAGYLALFLFLLWLFRRAILVQSNLRHNLRVAQIEIEKDHEMAEMKARFFNNITHELRTPITLIKGPVEELLTHEDLPEEQRKNYYHTVHQNANRLYRLVNRLLDFRKSETGHFKLQAAQDDIIPFAREIFLSFKQLAKDRGINYIFEAPSEPLSLFFDHNKMEIVLCNLLSNAFKHTENGDEIRMCIDRRQGQCCLKVVDTGKGMPPEEADKIFNRFYQISRMESSKIVGTGIGLSMVKSIVDLHRGKINVDTHVGTGSTFILQFPLGHAHLKKEQLVSNFLDSEDRRHYPSAPVASREPLARSVPGGRLPKLLLVEDNPEIRAFIRSIFLSDFVIREAANGLEGLAAVEKEIPDIIISDIMMDQMDGITFCGRIKENPDFFHIPLILLTARTSNVYQVDGLSSGADAYLTKPFDAQVLKAQVNSLLRLKASLREYYANRITLGPQKIEVTSAEVLFMEELIATVEAKLDEESLTAEKLAAAMGMSHSTLYRKVKSYTGESINSFIRSIRLKQAAQLLVDSDLNVSQIAYRVGFADVNYFGKCFKQQFGMSPTAFIHSAP